MRPSRAFPIFLPSIFIERFRFLIRPPPLFVPLASAQRLHAQLHATSLRLWPVPAALRRRPYAVLHPRLKPTRRPLSLCLGRPPHPWPGRHFEHPFPFILILQRPSATSSAPLSLRLILFTSRFPFVPPLCCALLARQRHITCAPWSAPFPLCLCQPPSHF